mmetsp:Transcript_12999/g.18636  ORF Transcript_12999/g.18636 Transcript_12999/m.18636 type:complete len:533 (-) Transcript_12999:79-1677(-)|eukprot:CAMPEP_0172414556 /NCGR_PEP_ID=MMETSP1064-20121228/1206_1 /TAXON_ID=202472 /ORGANISM="Aulacoseira subarctica , Strain CCAP 1002/5" /LENGTH=532 /DNA_ID=CAMNT_0013151283 /DNA_START=37 /DNA_END=1635 /DNA_ORIENTATION=-
MTLWINSIHVSLLLFAIVGSLGRVPLAAPISVVPIALIGGRIDRTIIVRRRNNLPVYFPTINRQQDFDLKASMQEQNQKKNSENIATDKNKEYTTLYELLQVPSNATREQIKQSYIRMARITHPDAMNSSGLKVEKGDNEAGGVKFSEIAAAYKLLSDSKERKRYDRSLVAESFKKEVEKAAAEVGSAAGPQIFNILRRTRATTNAVIASTIKELQQQPLPTENSNSKNVAASDSRSKNPLNIAKVLNSAIQAGQAASRAIDKLEMVEKSRKLEIQARKELIQAKVLRAKAADVAEQRLLVAMRTPYSAITSVDAKIILGRLNSTSIEHSFSLIDIMSAKRSIHGHIQRLEDIEKVYNGITTELNLIEIDFKKATEIFDSSIGSLNAAVEAEKKAREAFMRAQKELVQAKQIVSESKRNATTLEVNRNRMIKDAESMAIELMRYQERVRTELWTKCEGDPNFKEKPATTPDPAGASVGDDTKSLSTLAELIEKEDSLIKEILRLENLAVRMTSRAEKLKKNAGDPFAEVQRD